MHTHARRADLPALTSLRALAALTVFAFHLGRWGIVSTGPLGYGYAGVTFFFVLSGFVLTWSHNPDRSRRDFYVGRFARVWPSHGVIWVLLLLVPLATRPFTAGQAALNVLLVQAWVPDAAFHLNGVTWSLSCEASFYLLFPFALDALTRLRLTAAWLVVAGLLSLQGVLTLWVASWPDQGAWATVVFTNPLLRLPEFLVGVCSTPRRDGGNPPASLKFSVPTPVTRGRPRSLRQARGRFSGRKCPPPSPRLPLREARAPLPVTSRRPAR